jgi:hypothetical protein
MRRNRVSKMTLRSTFDWKIPRVECRTDGMEVFALSAAQRRMLVELLASESEGSTDVRLDSARGATLDQLVELGGVSHCQGGFVLTRPGQDVALHLADLMLGAPGRIEGYA